MIACMMLVAGCSKEPAKEVSQVDDKPNTSVSAGNEINATQKSSEETEKSETPEDRKEESKAVSSETENKVSNQSTSKPIAETTAKPSSQYTQSSTPQTQTSPEVTSPQKPKEEQPRVEQPVQPKPQETKPVEQPKPAEEPKPVVEVFDVGPYVSSAKSYAQSIGLTLDSSATECWDNPITANAKRTDLNGDIQGRLNRYKNVEGYTGVWIWSEKVSDAEYEIYIGYY